MTMKFPHALTLSGRSSSFRRGSANSGNDASEGDRGGSSETPGLWTGSREGIVASIVAFAGAVVFGGGAGVWFAPGASGWMGQALAIAAGSMVMAAIVCLTGSLLVSRRPVFWGIGMPLLVYSTGTVFALLSGYAGAGMLFFGAPVFMGLAFTAGVMIAFLLDREN